MTYIKRTGRLIGIIRYIEYLKVTVELLNTNSTIHNVCRIPLKIAK